MPTVKVKIKETLNKSYEILIAEDLSTELLTFLKKSALGRKYAIITDNKVKRLYAVKLQAFLNKNGIQSHVFSFTEGEKSKTLQTVESIANEMITQEFDRKDAIIALGGGVVGDLAALLASLYMRGLPHIQIPTTLLAMVDSSVGGKTAVDLESGKNLLGTFEQPKAVFIETKYLKTLPEKQIRNGLAEVIKYGVIKDKKLFETIEKHHQEILALSPKRLIEIIERSISIKATIIEADEKENGNRMLLNYGHTYGHAIEKMSNYKLLHGFAISIGMVIANKIAVDKKLLKAADAERIKKLFKGVGLPITTLQKPTLSDLKNDKKRDGEVINFILPTKIGHAQICPQKIQ